MLRKTTRNTIALAASLALAAGMTPAPALAADAPALDARTSGAVVMYIGSPLAYVNNARRMIDADASVTPVIENNRTLVPLRFASEAFDSTVSWDPAARAATVTRGGTKVVFTDGSDVMTVAGARTQMEAAAKIVSGRFLIPMRFLAQALGKQVFYDRGLIIISDIANTFDPAGDRPRLDAIIALVNDLPTVGSADDLVKLIGKPQGGMTTITGNMDSRPTVGAPVPSPSATAPAPPQMSQESNAASPDYSKTNIQVAGVDEGDIIKTDGQYVYYLRNNVISVVNAVPPDAMSLAFTVAFDDPNFSPQEIYVYGNKLAVLGNTIMSVSGGSGNTQVFGSRAMTAAMIYDITDKQNVKKLREADAEGSYLSSRVTGGTLVFISTQYMWALGYGDSYIAPAVRDTASGPDYAQIGYDKVRYFPGGGQNSVISVTGMDLGGSAPAKNAVFLGGGYEIYMSPDNLYVVSNDYNFKVRPVVPPPIVQGSGGAASEPAVIGIPAPPVNTQPSTTVYKFSLSGGAATFLAKGSVSGTLLNRYSMDENGGYFRIATTSTVNDGNNWQQSNNIYVLGDDMRPVGQITNIAPGERIYSVRYMGSRAYMVTFQQVDPFFVIDLSSPTAPKILGALKIPGYSDFLQPYDDTHVIGFGKDTYVQKGMAYYLGMKLAMFDVSDVANPKQMFTYGIGGRGTSSAILSDPKALLFSKDKGLLAFPVDLYTVPAGTADPLTYGTFTYQGLYVFGVNLTDGFTLKGRVTHLTDADMLKSASYGGDNTKYVQRAVYIGDYIYTVSQGEIKATDMTTMQDAGDLKF